MDFGDCLLRGIAQVLNPPTRVPRHTVRVFACHSLGFPAFSLRLLALASRIRPGSLGLVSLSRYYSDMTIVGEATIFWAMLGH